MSVIVVFNLNAKKQDTNKTIEKVDIKPLLWFLLPLSCRGVDSRFSSWRHPRHCDWELYLFLVVFGFFRFFQPDNFLILCWWYFCLNVEVLRVDLVKLSMTFKVMFSWGWAFLFSIKTGSLVFCGSSENFPFSSANECKIEISIQNRSNNLKEELYHEGQK